MAKKKLSRDQLIAHRNEHVDFLKSSAAAFDAGFTGEAKRMAVSLRVLLHETAASHSILAQLGERRRSMVDTAFPYDPRNLLTHHGLVGIRVGQSASFCAHLDQTPVPGTAKKFSDWWERDIVVKDTQGLTYTRRRLVLHAANKDGGAHVDPVLDDDFEKLKSGAVIGWIKSTADGYKPIEDVIAHSIRQITYETLTSFTK